MMRIETIHAAELSAEQIDLWSKLQRSQSDFDSPYFHPEFALAVAAVRKDVEVAILEDDGKIAGFFPFQRSKGGVGMPVGGRMSDFQGVIVDPSAQWTCEELLRGCKLSAWHFDHLLSSQKPFQPYHWHTSGSPYLDLSGGWKGYEEQMKREHHTAHKKLMQKYRGAERKAGEVRFEYGSSDSKLFELLVEWKRKQYRATGVPDVLAYGWTKGLLREILDRRTAEFSGILSALYIDGLSAALLLSMRSGDVMHAWFTAYGPQFAEFSPGLLLWIELAKAADAEGFRRVDLGKGPEEYKRHFMSGEIALAEGSADTRPLAGMIHRVWDRTYRWLRNSPLKKPLLVPGRFVKRILAKRDT